jgi:hypothetical protein
MKTVIIRATQYQSRASTGLMECQSLLKQMFYDMLPILLAGKGKVSVNHSVEWSKKFTLCVKVVRSGMVAICSMYRASFSSSRSAIASGVCAFLNAEIFRPSRGFNAKLRL